MRSATQHCAMTPLAGRNPFDTCTRKHIMAGWPGIIDFARRSCMQCSCNPEISRGEGADAAEDKEQRSDNFFQHVCSL